jgi:hypothetical protein
MFSEGNLYNVEDEFGKNTNASDIGLDRWKQEVIKQLRDNLSRQNIPNIEEIVSKVFGHTLD